ncbi:hypothetical protein LWX53_07610, partial [bacterium]|nr:hypothetical protein [bacterium]
MVQRASARRMNFALFIAPALALYALFFLVPFGQGLRISFTNWDGLTPKTPISMPKADFEASILAKLSEGEKAFVLSVYTFDEGAGNYARLSVSGLTRYRLERVMKKAGYVPAAYRDVGLKNYCDIFAGGVDKRFYPRAYEETYYNQNSSLPQEIDAASYEKRFLARLGAGDAALAAKFYAASPGGKSYALKPEMDEFLAEDALWSLPAAASGAVDSKTLDDFISAARKAGLARDRGALEIAAAGFSEKAARGPAEKAVVEASAARIFEIGGFKSLLASTWKARRFDLGVIGFTIFFAVGNVVLSNLLAFWLAMALDRKLKSR